MRVTSTPGPSGRPNGPVRGVLFDLDGTVYLGDALIPGAAGAIATLKARGVAVAYLSNKPIEPRSAYAGKLTRLGIPTATEEVVTSSFVLARWLSQEAPGATLFVIGEPPLLEELTGAGFRLADDPGRVDVVVAALDRGFDYRKLSIAMAALKLGARFVATNPDRTCPVDGGEIPDCAAVIGALEGCTGRKVEAVVGKPSPLMLEVALDQIGLGPEDCLIVGDRLETDVQMGRRAGIRTALVLTGVTRPSDLPDDPDARPDVVLESVRDLPRLLERGLVPAG
jgi:arabinose operon protein AraL